MKRKVGILGSCVTRDAFNSRIVHNYKDFFEVAISAQRTSIISIMQDPFLVDEKLIEIYPKNRGNNARSNFIYNDLNKTLIKDLLEKKIDYLVIDNYLEVRLGILYFNETIITNNDWDLPRTEFYENINDKLILKITKYPEEYFYIWSKYCDLFFKFLKIYCPHVKVVINKGRQTDKVLTLDKTIHTLPEFTSRAKIINPLLDKLDDYMINNFDVEVIEFDYENTYADENHIWRFAPVHYNEEFYYSLIEQLKNMGCKEDFLKNEKNNLNKYDEYSFQKELNKTHYETKLFLKNLKYRDHLNFYNKARVDIKNFGSKDNKLEIIKSNTPISEKNFPKWFKTDEGEGLSITSYESPLNMKLKCINNGILKIYLRGPNVRAKNNVRFPVYIDYTDFKVNGESLLKENKLIWHNKPTVFKKNVNNSDIIDIHIEWLPFNESSTYNP